MSNLNHQDIKAYLMAEDIKVSPFDSDLIGPASLDFRLGDHFTITEPKDKFGGVIDPLNRDSFISTTIQADNYILYPGAIVCASMLEHLSLSTNVSAKIYGKSSLARLGIDQSSPGGWIDPGWVGQLTMLITNFSRYKVRLTKGMKIGQLVFFAHEHTELSYEQAGRYQNQAIGAGSLGIPEHKKICEHLFMRMRAEGPLECVRCGLQEKR